MIYRNSKGKFISHQEWLYLQIKEKQTMNNSRRRKHTQSAAELNAPQEQVVAKSEIAEGTQIASLGSDFDLDDYKRKVEEFEKSMEDEDIPQDKVIQEKLKEPVVIKTPGFFTTWFKKWF